MALPYFTDPDKLQGRRFSYALGPYSPQEPNFTESVELSLYVDDQGTINTGNTLLLHPDRDPVDCVSIPEFTKGNKFVQGLNRVLDTLPTGSIILFPTYRFDRNGASPVSSDALYPDHTPPGFVPCANQLLEYKGGGTIRVPYIPMPAAGMPAVYMMKVPPGWKTPDPALPLGSSKFNLASIISLAAPLIP